MAKIPRVINEDQFKRIIERMHWHNKTACYLMFYCGLRVSEVVKLKVQDIDLKKNRVFIRASKNLKNRYVPLHPKVRDLIQSKLEFFQLQDEDKTLLFEADRRWIWASVKYNSKKLGLEDVHPHTLRHSFATRLLDKGLTMRDVQVLLGHSDVSTTMVYTHTSLKSIEDKLRSVGEL